MSKSKKCAALVAQLTGAMPTWDAPVTVTGLHNADQTHSRPTIASALKQMVDKGLLYATVGYNDQTFYYSASKRPMCAIQELLTKGFARAKL